MNQNIWGPHLWFSLHTISFNYPLNPSDSDKENCKNFFKTLQYVIPCSVCKKNYIRHLKELPIEKYVENRKALVYWTIDMHNLVNGEIGKKILSYDNVIKKYENVYKKKIILEGVDDNDENIEYKTNNINYEMIINGLFLFFIILLIINLINIFIKKNKLKL
jgi:hypothetical protein